MTEQVNIAEEIAELAVGLQSGGSKPGWQHLSRTFAVEPWSADFYGIIHAILVRLTELEKIISSSDMRVKTATAAIGHVRAIAMAFNHESLTQRWDQCGAQYVGNIHSDPILSLSASLSRFDYERPASDEAEEIIADAVQLLEWLESHQLEENDFIRGCIIVGVRQFIFRVQKLEWFGWEQSIASLREVIAAYLALQRGDFSQESHPMIVAMGKKLISGLGKALKIVSGARNVTDDAQFMFQAYGSIVKVASPATSYIAGYLSNQN